MITIMETKKIVNNKQLVDIACLSTDTKPTTGIMNGSMLIETDTGKVCIYNEEDGEWTEIGSGGGGGGSSDFTTAKVSVDATDVEVLGVSANSVIYFPDAENGYNTSLNIPSTGGNVLLYQNEGRVFNLIAIDTNEHPLENALFTFSGDAEWDAENNELIISGDCTIHVSEQK